MENLPDYLYLNIIDATVDGNKYTWTIPYSYYGQNRRGPICYVSLADCNIYADYEGGIVIKYENGVQNMIDISNKPGAYLGSVQLILGPTQTNYQTFHNSQCIKLLTESKPMQITLSTSTMSGVAQAIDNGLFVLRFEYYNQEETIHNYHKSQYNL